jgi:hypothetical protein
MLWIALAVAAATAPEVRFAAGGEAGPTSYGVVELGVRSGPWSAELLTDTVDLRWASSSDRGRSWIGLRGVAATAGFFLFPWEEGRPAPERAWQARSLTLDAGRLRYARGGWYGGGRVAASGWIFAGTGGSYDPPAPTVVGTADALGGLWTDRWRGWGRLGLDVGDGAVAPHASFELLHHDDADAGLVLAIRAGVGYGQTDVTRTRLGGSSPYFVPLVGFAAAEHRVEDYAALRVGASFDAGVPAFSLYTDAAAFDGDVGAGFGARVAVEGERWFARAEGGVAPWVPRGSRRGDGGVFVWFGRGFP